MLPLINMKAAARQNLDDTLTRNNEADNYNVQMQVRQLEHESDARLSQSQREVSSRFSQEATQALEDQRENLVTEATSEVRRRDEQVFDYVQNSVFVHCTRKTLRNNSQEYVGPHQHLTGLVQETQQYREMFVESRAAQSAAGPQIARLRQREAELPQEVRRHQKKVRAKIDAL